VRGRGIDPERALVRIRARQRDVSAADLETRAIDVATRVEQAYWDLVAARRETEVAVEAANLARVQLERDQRMIAAGTLPPVELSAAEAELEGRLDDLYRASGAVTAVENALKTLLARDPHDDLWREEILPEDAAPAAAPPEVADIQDSFREALRRRPELKSIDALRGANETMLGSPNETLSTLPKFTQWVGWTGFGTSTLGGGNRVVTVALKILF